MAPCIYIARVAELIDFVRQSVRGLFGSDGSVSLSASHGYGHAVAVQLHIAKALQFVPRVGHGCSNSNQDANSVGTSPITERQGVLLQASGLLHDCDDRKVRVRVVGDETHDEEVAVSAILLQIEGSSRSPNAGMILARGVSHGMITPSEAADVLRWVSYVSASANRDNIPAEVDDGIGAYCKQDLWVQKVVGVVPALCRSLGSCWNCGTAEVL
ncbi:hypothetical protein Pelo_6439 [Pelomyxa schiedti]|nr:hypothetical protein Pelo_6439 [Pelomyxa schiedti]